MSGENPSSQLLRENRAFPVGFRCLTYTEVYKTKPKVLEVSVIHQLLRARYVAVALLALVSQSAFAVRFTQREFKFEAAVKSPISLDLKSVVKEVSLGQVLKFTAHNLPSYLTHDEANYKIVGLAPTVGTPPQRFGVEVTQGNSTDFAFFEYSSFAAPKWKQAVLDLGTQYEGLPFSLDLKTYLESGRTPRGLSFSATGLPYWMSLSADGTLSGIPTTSNLGTYTGIMFRVEGPFGTYATAGAGGEVRRAPILPKWTKNAITIEDAVEDVLFERVLAEFVSNPDNLPLTFKLVGQVPSWINVTNLGKLFGIPRRQHVGPTSVEVELSAAGAASTAKETVKFTFQVLRLNKAPLFKSDPVILPKALQGNPFMADLSNYVDDPDLALGDGLFLEILSGPTWASIAPPALFKGTPPTNQVGVQTWRVRVSDVAGLSAIANVQTEVLKANQPPKLQPGLKFTMKERAILSDDLAKFATDAENDPIVFEGLTLPSWVTLSPAGKVQLSPQHSDIGEHTIALRLGDGTSKVIYSFQVTVQADPKPPIWLVDPVRIDAISGTAFAQSIADKAHDLDGGALTFAKVSGPNWLAVDAAGRVGGLPKDADVGVAKFVLSAKNSIGETQATLLVNVKQGNRPPTWSQDPLSLVAAKINVSFSFDLASFVKDADGDVLRFTKVLAPNWLRLTADGKVGGIPTSSDMGEYAAVFEVTDGKFAVQVGAKGRVGDGNSLPTLKGAALTFSVKQKATLTENLAQSKYVEDSDGDSLTFAALGFPAWASLSAQGSLALNPTDNDAGTHSLRIEVSDGKGSVQGVVTVRVAKDPRPPLWLEDPVQLTTMPNVTLTVPLSAKVQEFDNLTLTFQKISGPTWFNVTTNGVASGTPTTSNLGMNTFVISASSTNGTVEATIKVNVRTTALTQVIALDNMKSAATEILWVIDNAGPTLPYLSNLYSGAKDFYAGLTANGISASSAVLSTREWDGRLLTDNVGAPLLVKSSAIDTANDFRLRVERAQTGDTRTSPFWALTRLYEMNPRGSRGQVASGYWSEGVPMEVFILTAAGDSHRQLSAGTNKQNYAAADYQRSFTSYHSAADQPFTMSVYDLRCPAVYNPANPAVRPEYLTVVNATLGTYFYQASSCQDQIKGALKTFMDEVSLRAQVYSHRRFKPAAPPIHAYLKLQLKRANGSLVDLPGNTGASDDTWNFDRKTYDIVVHWNKIRLRVQPGDSLQMRY